MDDNDIESAATLSSLRLPEAKEQQELSVLFTKVQSGNLPLFSSVELSVDSSLELLQLEESREVPKKVPLPLTMFCFDGREARVSFVVKTASRRTMEDLGCCWN